MFAGDEIDKNKNENLRRFTRQISFIYEISGGMERPEIFIREPIPFSSNVESWCLSFSQQISAIVYSFLLGIFEEADAHTQTDTHANNNEHILTIRKGLIW